MVYYFTFIIDNEIIFRTQVSSIQCREITKKGVRCKRKTVIGSAYCCTHLACNHHLKIKKSTIPDAGKGLFAVDNRSKDPNEVIFKKRNDYRPIKATASLKATRNIKNGEEIFLSYGSSYKLNEPGVESYTSTK
jgi:hypothetical protein